MNRRILPDRPLTPAETQSRYRKHLRADVERHQRMKERNTVHTREVTVGERIQWQRIRVQEAESRLIEQRGTIHQALWEAVVQARRAELRRLEAVQS